jgi:hypothetical protein
MASKTVYVFFYSEHACLSFADKHAERILHMGYGTFDPAGDDSKHGTNEDEDCTDKNRWFVRITLDDSNLMASETSNVVNSSDLKPVSRKRRGGV